MSTENKQFMDAAKAVVPDPSEPGGNSCPKCGGHSFRLVATFDGTVCITFNADDAEDFVVDDSDPTDSEWDGPATCRDCGWEGTLADLVAVKEEEEDTCDCCNGPLVNRIVAGESIFCSQKCADSPNRYAIASMSFPWKADKRNESLSSSELKRGHRVIGGDKGDVWFDGYDVDEDGTHLRNPVLVTFLKFTPDETNDIAVGIVEESYASVGTECVE